MRADRHAPADGADFSRVQERRQFAKILTAQGLSVLGSQFAFVALPLAVYVVTGSASSAGVVGIVNALSRTATFLVGGAVADRFRQTTIMIICDLGRLVGNLLLFWIIFSRSSDSLLVLCLLVVVEGVLSALFTPAEVVAIRRIVSAERLPARLARSESVSWTAALVGPPIGGMLFAVNPSFPFLGNAASYVLSAALIAVTVVSRQAGGEPHEAVSSRRPAQLLQGLRFVLADRFLRSATLQIALHNVALGALSIIVLVGAQQRGVPGGLIGVMVGAQALGALLGSLCAPWVLRRLTAGQTVLLTGWSWIVLIPIIVLVHHWLLLSVLLGLLWFVAPMQRTVIGAYQGQRAATAMLGRVNSGYTLLTASLAALGPGIGGVLLAAGNPGLSVCAFVALTVPPVLWSTFVSRISTTRIDVAV
jgi:MFS transporter